MVPYDDKSAFVTSGIRFGVAAVTTRGMLENDMQFVVNAIDKALMNADDAAILAGLKKKSTHLWNNLYCILNWDNCLNNYLDDYSVDCLMMVDPKSI